MTSPLSSYFSMLGLVSIIGIRGLLSHISSLAFRHFLG